LWKTAKKYVSVYIFLLNFTKTYDILTLVMHYFIIIKCIKKKEDKK